MPRSRSLLVAGILATLTGCSSPADSGQDRPANEQVVPTAPKLVVELAAVNPIIKEGEEPDFVAVLVNQGREAVTVVLPGDGSACGWRTPIIRWTPSMQVGVRCGNINSLKSDEVRTLEPGERVVIDWLGFPSLQGKGKHRVSMELEHIPDREWAGIPSGQHDPAAMKRIRESTPWTAKSNVVEVIVN